MEKKGIRENQYIEYLDEAGWHWVPNNSYKKRNLKRKCLLLFFSLFIVPLAFVTYSKFSSQAVNNNEIQVAKWNFKINSVGTQQLNIDLAKTITANNFSLKHVIPGTSGVINLEMDFSNVDVDLEYSIDRNIDGVVVPNNLKFYTDASMTEEFTSFNGTVKLEDITTPVVKTIYWKWAFTTDDESEWEGKDISFALDANVSQLISG